MHDIYASSNAVERFFVVVIVEVVEVRHRSSEVLWELAGNKGSIQEPLAFFLRLLNCGLRRLREHFASILKHECSRVLNFIEVDNRAVWLGMANFGADSASCNLH